MAPATNSTRIQPRAMRKSDVANHRGKNWMTEATKKHDSRAVADDPFRLSVQLRPEMKRCSLPITIGVAAERISIRVANPSDEKGQ